MPQPVLTVWAVPSGERAAIRAWIGATAMAAMRAWLEAAEAAPGDVARRGAPRRLALDRGSSDSRPVRARSPNAMTG